MYDDFISFYLFFLLVVYCVGYGINLYYISI